MSLAIWVSSRALLARYVLEWLPEGFLGGWMGRRVLVGGLVEVGLKWGGEEGEKGWG